MSKCLTNMVPIYFFVFYFYFGSNAKRLILPPPPPPPPTSRGHSIVNLPPVIVNVMVVVML